MDKATVLYAMILASENAKSDEQAKAAMDEIKKEFLSAGKQGSKALDKYGVRHQFTPGQRVRVIPPQDRQEQGAVEYEGEVLNHYPADRNAAPGTIDAEGAAVVRHQGQDYFPNDEHVFPIDHPNDVKQIKRKKSLFISPFRKNLSYLVKCKEGKNQGKPGPCPKGQQEEQPTLKRKPATKESNPVEGITPPEPIESTPMKSETSEETFRPSKPEERRATSKPPSLKKKLPPPKPLGKSKAPKNKEGRPITGYSANGIANTYTGDVIEDAFSKLGLRKIQGQTKEGKAARSHAAGKVKEQGSSLDFEFGNSGEFFEAKACCIEAQEYKAAPKKEELEDKERFCELHKGQGNTMIVVVDTDGLKAHAYWKPGIQATRLTEKNFEEWNYAGSVELDPALVQEAREKTQAAIEKKKAKSGQTEGKAIDMRVRSKARPHPWYGTAETSDDKKRARSGLNMTPEEHIEDEDTEQLEFEEIQAERNRREKAINRKVKMARPHPITGRPETSDEKKQRRTESNLSPKFHSYIEDSLEAMDKEREQDEKKQENKAIKSLRMRVRAKMANANEWGQRIERTRVNRYSERNNVHRVENGNLTEPDLSLHLLTNEARQQLEEQEEESE